MISGSVDTAKYELKAVASYLKFLGGRLLFLGVLQYYFGLQPKLENIK